MPCPSAGSRRRVCQLFHGKAEQSPDGGVARAGDRAGQLSDLHLGQPHRACLHRDQGHGESGCDGKAAPSRHSHPERHNHAVRFGS